MATVHALLVGINHYAASDLDPLEGCLNDVEDAEQFLRSVVQGTRELRLRSLRGEKATREAVTTGLRDVLGDALPGDVVLFWFSGHGATAPVPPELKHLEPEGFSQTLVCVDSRCDGVPDLFDYELAALIGCVPATGVHVVAVLDSCHAEGATRNPRNRLRARLAPPLTDPPALDTLVPEVRALNRTRGVVPATTNTRGNHVTLAACRNRQLAQETPDAPRTNGVFTAALLKAAKRLGESASYRDLMLAARVSVENDVPGGQNPVLTPDELDIVDQPFLGGRTYRHPAAAVLRSVHGAWEVTVGASHGLPAAGQGEIRFGVYDSDPVREVRVTRVRAEASRVEPIDWEPETDTPYRVVLTGIPIPRTTVSIDADDTDVAARMTRAIRTATPGGRPSLHLELLDPDDPRVATLRVGVRAGEPVNILGANGVPLASTGDADEPARIVADLEHIARWWRLRDLEHPIESRLADAVRLEIVPARSDEPWSAVVDDRRPALAPSRDCAYLLEYSWRHGVWEPPGVFIRLRNTAKRPLFCVLLSLTDRFAVDTGLFPGKTIKAEGTAAAWEGGMLEFRLPPGLPVGPGAQARDWLKLLVSEEPLDPETFRMGRLGEPQLAHRSAAALCGIFGQLSSQMLRRDAGPRPRPTALDWATTTVEVVTRIPDRPHSGPIVRQGR